MTTPPASRAPIPAADFMSQFPRLFRRSAWRLETLDLYDSPQTRERMARFAAGEPIDPRPREHWLAMLRDGRSAGRTVGRVHVVGPLNDYLRYEIACYKQNAAAGEDIRLMPRDRGAALGLPEFDFWLLDSESDDEASVAVMKYGERGVLICAEFVTDPRFVAQCRRWRDIATSNAIPLSKYQAGRTAA
jgi:hypothetical protein